MAAAAEASNLTLDASAEEDGGPSTLTEPCDVKKKDVIVSTSRRPRRERKKVQCFNASQSFTASEVEIFQGGGSQISELDGVTENLRSVTRTSALLMKMHRIMFGGRVGVATKRKAAVLQFSGFASTGEEHHEQVVERIMSWTLPDISGIMDILQVDRRSVSFPDGRVSKAGLADRLARWLAAPVAATHKIRGGSSGSGSTPKRGAASRSKAKAKTTSATRGKKGKRKRQSTAAMFSASANFLNSSKAAKKAGGGGGGSAASSGSKRRRKTKQAAASVELSAKDAAIHHLVHAILKGADLESITIKKIKKQLEAEMGVEAVANKKGVIRDAVHSAME